jgi:hypothetical protein
MLASSDGAGTFKKQAVAVKIISHSPAATMRVENEVRSYQDTLISLSCTQGISITAAPVWHLLLKHSFHIDCPI